jgi:hypothetical protein
MQTHDELVKEYLLKKMAEEKETLATHSKLIQEFKLYCGIRGLDLQDENFRYFETVGIIAQYPDLLKVICPELEIDKEGLCDLDHLLRDTKRNPYFAGTIHMGNFKILASHYFRRRYFDRNNYSPYFIPLYWGHASETYNRSILLDNNRVRIDVDGPIHFERDTWYGAKFDENISCIPDGNVKLRPPGYLTQDHISSFFGSAYSIDIKWDTKFAIKTFQLEEFKTEEVTLNKEGMIMHPVRYVHAEYDMTTNCFRHFDGALHFYTPDDYIGRRDSDFNYNTKHGHQIKTESVKLFKLNGQIPVEIWVELTSHYLHGDPLIHEYFEGKYPKYIDDFLARLSELGRGG